jgi:hypothetical protein
MPVRGLIFLSFPMRTTSLVRTSSITAAVVTILALSSMIISPLHAASTLSSQKVISLKNVVKMADAKYADGNVPLGDGMHVSDGAKKGYVYLCNARTGEEGGAGQDGPWIDSKNKVWNFLQKISISGSVKWAQAKFSNTTSAQTRTLVGNNLPINHTTGTFPVASSDDAYEYDRNPNSIKAQTEKKYELPLNPTYSETPYCMSGGEVGIMTTGVMMFNAFDATLRDAPAHELQDDCDGHPQKDGIYHYHSMSSCLKNVSVLTVVGYAFDGFPITGPKVGKDRYLSTEDLDECHGITSTIIVDGKQKTMYHYVLTQDFPYSVSCYRGKPIEYSGNSMQNTTQGNSVNQNQPQTGTPPPEATTACSGKKDGNTCSFTTPDKKSISGTCKTVQSGSVACVPVR